MILIMFRDMDISANTFKSVKYRIQDRCYQKVRVFESYNDGRFPNELNNKNIDFTCDKGVSIDEDGYIRIDKRNHKYGIYNFTATYRLTGETDYSEFNYIEDDIYL